MKRWILAGLLFGLIACNTSVDRSPDAKPRVVSTSTILADLTERVGGEEIDHTGILKPGTDPHVYEPVPADNIALEKADIIFYNGYNLEPGLIKLMDSAGINARKVAVGEVVTPLDIRKEGRSVPDPHVWGDARNGIAMTRKIRDELIQLSPADKAVFTENADRLIAELEKLDTWIKASIRTIPSARRRLVTTHDAFQYYAKAYGLSVTGTLIGISTEEQPSARTLKDLALAIRKTNVPAIFAETTINPALITTVAREAGVKLAPRQLYSDSIGPADSDAGSYGKMLAANTRTIVGALGGKVLPGPE